MVRPGAARTVIARTVLATFLLGASWARAEPDVSPPVPTLVVDRGPGAEQCPDATELAARVLAMRGKERVGKAVYEVQFTHDDAGYEVKIALESTSRARTLTSKDAACDPIANATAVTLALLFDADASEATPPVAPPPLPTPEPAPRRAHPKPEKTREVPKATVSVAGAGLALVTGPFAFGFIADAGLVVSRFRAALGVLWTGPVVATLAPGHVEESLVAGSAKVCFAPVTGKWRADLCSGALVGRAAATATGYTRNETRDRTWLAVPIGVSGSYFGRHLGVEVGFSALLPVERTDFSIQGLGVPYASSSVGFLTSLGVVGLLPF